MVFPHESLPLYWVLSLLQNKDNINSIDCYAYFHDVYVSVYTHTVFTLRKAFLADTAFYICMDVFMWL